MQTYRAELHVHTVLSPCASVEMIPPLIVQTALDQGIRLIAITDHNTCTNAGSVMKAAEQSDLVVLPGMELQTREEVHLLCLFENLEICLAWQEVVDQRLPNMQNNPEYFGEQFVVDETGELVQIESRLLLNSVQLSLEEAIQQIHELGGLAIPAHIDRKAFGLIENLGMIPAGLQMDALEISRQISPDSAIKKYPQAAAFPLLQSGDVHHLEDFLGACYFTIQAPTLAEVRLALRQAMGRKMEIKPNI
jgi:3',5'-nucleoside bisphosphate phosphatase